MSSRIRTTTAAGVVAFNPDANTILPLVRSVIRDVDYVFVFVNAIIDHAITVQLEQLAPRCQVIKSEYNLGVAEALNIIALHSMLHGCDHVVLFDQDSRPPESLIPALRKSLDSLIEAGNRVAVIGPEIIAPRERSHEFKSPRYFRKKDIVPKDDLIPVHYVITSGSLIDLRAFRDIGKFRSDFFIDAIDTEWCFRAWSKGYSCWFDSNLPMEHTIGEGAVRSKVFGIRFPHQSPMRMYCYFRNQVASILLPHVPVEWKIKFGIHISALAVSMVAHFKFSPALIHHIARAMWNGFRGRLGPPPGAVRAAVCLNRK
ncbi:glycosyltransferase family 2 protein [Microvirga vignae]|uniref:glycosyltransferase family 2 protein n=1 Tax=Microvirga vignae TaxID=1225564 RepID=UPI00069AA413|nr:glycosyltransferase family 2 protein [Microvirga vignae]